jgi:hypothetical protein
MDFLRALKIHSMTSFGRSFTSPPKEAEPKICIVLKNPLLSAGFEPVNLGSNCKEDNHYANANNTLKV